MSGRLGPDNRFLVIAAGGTGGHMFPAQALAQEMLRRDWRIALSTDERGMRYAGGYPPEVERRKVEAATFARGGLTAKITAPFKIMSGVNEATAWFRKDRPTAVAGFGGYPSLPALTAAWRLNLPRILHEQNGVLGRVNKAFATRVHALACGVEPVSNLPAGSPAIFVGNPIRDDARRLAGAPYMNVEPDAPINLLIFGGSQGASVFSDTAPQAIANLPAELRSRLRIAHQVRAEEFGKVREVYVAAGVDAELSPFFENMPELISLAHLVLCRAGASTIAELGAIGRPSVLVPYPNATADHQTANARSFEEAGAAIMVKQDEFSPMQLTDIFAGLFNHTNRLDGMAAAARALGRPDAAQHLADLIEHVAAGGSLTDFSERRF
ncbi:MAG: undecaprenyldiphospho-muramoylpentapeptide beta-N-acetylglucosaminyltransferase [Neomegalonema sp.]|nr:undecaprenyldiphospho-muramoylpentapeptide beta-N-acetylglucosaminyltransferase [Neomegalonema sp.]